MSARSTQRPDSRASTMSATSQNEDASQTSQITHPAAPAAYQGHGPEVALLQYQAGMPAQHAHSYDMLGHHPQHFNHQHSHSASFPMQGGYAIHDGAYVQTDMGYGNHARVGSVPAQSVAEMQDDKRRKGAAVTATNDKELREMLAKNEGRPLRDVAQEVIQKERTPMAEKTKQLFAMLW